MGILERETVKKKAEKRETERGNPEGTEMEDNETKGDAFYESNGGEDWGPLLISLCIMWLDHLI